MSNPLTEISLTVRADADVILNGAFPQAEYMYGCVPTAVGMLLGYYDLYGYQGQALDNLIDGVITVDSRGLDGNAHDMDAFDTTLGNFIASPDYVDRFYDTSAASELPYTFLINGSEVNLNTGAWNSLADYLGTGQSWRDNDDLSTTVHFMTLAEILHDDRTVARTDSQSEVSFAFKYLTMLYGLSLYVESRDYQLNPEITGSFVIDSSGGTFTFADYMAEIDAGRSVIVNIEGHAMVGYGYNAETYTVIFDDCYQHDQQMTWGGSYFYSDVERQMQSVTIIGVLVEDIDLSISARTLASDTLLLAKTPGATAFNGYFYATDSIYLSCGIHNAGNDTSKPFEVSVTLNNELFGNHLWINGVAPGQQQDIIDFSLTGLASGAYTITVTADPHNQIEETDGNNNSASKNFLVLPYDISFWHTGTHWVQTGQTVNNMLITSGSVGLVVEGGGATSGIFLDNSTQMQVKNGGIANATYIAHGSQYILMGGQSNNITALSNTQLIVAGKANGITLFDDSLASIYNTGQISDADIFGQLQVYGYAENLTVNAGGTMFVYSGGTAQDVDLSGYLQVNANGIICDLTLQAGYSLFLNQNVSIDGYLRLFAPYHDLTSTQAQSIDSYEFILQENLFGPYLSFASGELTGNADIYLDVSAAIEGTYILLAGDLSNLGNATFSVSNDTGTFSITLNGEAVQMDNGQQVSLSSGDGQLSVEVLFLPMPSDLLGTADRLTWTAAEVESTYTVQLSNDSFANVISLTVSENAIDLYNLPTGTYQWRVTVAGQELWVEGNTLSIANPTPAQIIAPTANQNGDLMFAIATGTWSEGYFACHTGTHNGENDWNGTLESVSIAGLNKITDVFYGSNDSNILLLSDNGSGDAIFLDDIYSYLPQDLLGPTGRLSNLQEIHGGAGNDIIDFSSSRYAYSTATDLVLRGGDGNDHLWGNSQQNQLFGDQGDDHLIGGRNADLLVGGSGNDIMNGGGGSDIFSFAGTAWGNDIIRQVNNGDCIIWFADITAEDLTTKVSGLDVILTHNNDARITLENTSLTQLDLRFGAGNWANEFAVLENLGAFADYSSTSIFDAVQTTGRIASLS